ncbi:MAG: hypothetical protein AAF251_08570 [Pseudomonadota bacterium]
MLRAISLSLAILGLGSSACVSGYATTPPPSCAERLAAPSRVFILDVTASKARTVEMTVFAPTKPGTYPLIAFSHGAFAAPDRYTSMLKPLAGAGFIILAPMHIDSEDYPRAEGEPARPSHPITWATRNEDYALTLDLPGEMLAALKEKGLTIDTERLIALGHSYGALIAQLPGGALAFEPDGRKVDRTNTQVDAVVGWSPPGPMPGFMANEGWSTLTAPSLTITGTADILPGFVDDWKAHKASYDFAPKGQRALWVGEGIDHYFGGVFGREKPASENNRELFDRALARSLHFIETHSDAVQPCRLGSAIDGETYQED